MRELVDAHHPIAEKSVVVMDNIDILTCSAALHQVFQPAEGWRCWLAKSGSSTPPKHGSWLTWPKLNECAQSLSVYNVGLYAFSAQLEPEVVLSWQANAMPLQVGDYLALPPP